MRGWGLAQPSHRRAFAAASSPPPHSPPRALVFFLLLPPPPDRGQGCSVVGAGPAAWPPPPQKKGGGGAGGEKKKTKKTTIVFLIFKRLRRRREVGYAPSRARGHVLGPPHTQRARAGAPRAPSRCHVSGRPRPLEGLLRRAPPIPGGIRGGKRLLKTKGTALRGRRGRIRQRGERAGSC